MIFLAPKIVSILTNIMKPFVPEKTMSKIKIFGHDDKEWKAAILENVNPERVTCLLRRNEDRSRWESQLFYTGKFLFITRFIILIQIKINIWGKVPKSYYLRYKTDTTNKKSLSIPKI